MVVVQLKSCDNEVFMVDHEITRVSHLLKKLLSLCEDPAEYCIPLKDISSFILGKIIYWASYHKFNPPLYSPESDEEISEWDDKFLKQMDSTLFFEMVKASNYLESRTLLNLCSKHMANLIRGKTREQIWSSFKPAFQKYGSPMKK